MRTIEKAAKEFADIPADRVIDSEERYFNSNVRDYDAFIAGVEFAQRWIPVEEEMPEQTTDFPFTKYLVCVDIFAKNYSCGTVTVATFECGKWSTDRFDEDIIEIHVTHWRPIELK